MKPPIKDPTNIPRLCASVKIAMTDPIESVSLPLKTAIAINAGIEMPPPEALHPDKRKDGARNDQAAGDHHPAFVDFIRQKPHGHMECPADKHPQHD